MFEGRSVSLDVKYRPVAYSAGVRAQEEKRAGSEGQAAQVAGMAAGTAITLDKAPIYVSSTATTPAGHKSGVYYLYDGFLIAGRYRITNTAGRCGKTPVGKNVTGWLPAEYCGRNAEATPPSPADPPEQPPEPVGPATDITGYVENMTYVDNAADESDSIDITVDAEDTRWMEEWMPQKGATLYPKAAGHSWERPGDERVLECGIFVIDNVGYLDTPTTLQVGGVSKPSDTDFSDLERTVTWKNTSIKRIGETIAKRYGLGFSFDAEDQDIECDEQSGTDSSYYNGLCKNYGLVLKVYARRLWVYDREAYKAKPVVQTFDRTDIARGSMSWNTTLAGTYTGGTFDYTDPDTDSDISCAVGVGPKIKAINRRATSVHDAAIQLCAELNNANHGAIKLKFSVPGQWNVSAGCNIALTGYGNGPQGGDSGINGKYFVDKVTQKFTKSGGFVTTFECSGVREGFHPWDVGGEISYNAEAPTAGATKPAANASSAAAGGKAGAAVTLTGAPLYVSSTATRPAGSKSGVYYLYDGILINGRYRITNSPSRCGKLPVGKNVTGWVPAGDCTMDTGMSATQGGKAEMVFLQ